MLIANGHAAPDLYPLGMLLDEYIIAKRRNNRDLIVQMSLTKLAISANLSEEGGEAFTNELKRLGSG